MILVSVPLLGRRRGRGGGGGPPSSHATLASVYLPLHPGPPVPLPAPLPPAFTHPRSPLSAFLLVRSFSWGSRLGANPESDVLLLANEWESEMEHGEWGRGEAESGGVANGSDACIGGAFSSPLYALAHSALPLLPGCALCVTGRSKRAARKPLRTVTTPFYHPHCVINTLLLTARESGSRVRSAAFGPWTGGVFQIAIYHRNIARASCHKPCPLPELSR